MFMRALGNYVDMDIILLWGRGQDQNTNLNLWKIIGDEMEKLVTNMLTHDALRRVKIIGDSAFDAEFPIDALWRHGVYVNEMSVGRLQTTVQTDDALDLFSIDISWPVLGPWEVSYLSPKKFRRFMFVNFDYSERVSNCIEICRDQYFIQTHYAPRDAYVRELPKGAELYSDVHDCILQVAEWMPARCVAVGGFYG